MKYFHSVKELLKLDKVEDSYSTGNDNGRIRDNIKFFIPTILKQWKLALILGIVLIVASFLTYPMPMINRYFIDGVLLKKNWSMLAPILILMLLLGLTNSIISLIQSYFNTRFDQKITLDLQEMIMTKVLSLPKEFFDHNRKGYLMSRITSDISGIKWFFSGAIVQIFVQILKFFGGVGFLFYLEWRIAIPVIISLPAPFLVSTYFAKRMYYITHRSKEYSAHYNSVFQEIISTVPLIKAFSTEKKAVNNMVDEIKKNQKLAVEQMIINIINSRVEGFIPVIVKFMILGFGSYWIIKGEWTVGSLLAFQSYTAFVYGPINYLSSTIKQLQNSRAALERTATIFKISSEENIESGIHVEKLNGNIEFKNVDFSYDITKPVLDNISFKANTGEHWAVIGLSGVGKTTLINLIMRFYKPRKGEIYFDGIPVKDLNIRAFRRCLGYVSQKTLITSGTILENIKYGNENATLEEVIKATKTAEIHDFIESLDNGYNTIIDEDGANISEGQKQRISIARALVRNPDILIFDEPTAALDNVTEHSIYQHLPEAVKGKTSFTIAHRLGTIKNADKIIMLRKNNSPLIGLHEELLEKEYDYREFFDEL